MIREGRNGTSLGIYSVIPYKECQFAARHGLLVDLFEL